ncbi:ERF family protein [Nonomuraea sp. WAC 01424]|uniref:ERF family protein n=1 Tax=Nonomuraea sp. WAC 01424 TaxID=2203200 RepID=UPI00163C671A|nr:ERF family protein [Nonomuraea sp. WAC 01424]
MTEPQSVIQLIVEAKRKVGAIRKRERNTQQNFVYRGVEAVVNAVGPHLDKFGIVVVPIMETSSYETVEVGKNRTQMGHATVEVTYRFYGPAGDHIDARVPGEAMDSGDKAMAKAMAVAWRTALIQVLNLRTNDPEPDEMSYERSPAKTVEDFRMEALNGNATKQDLERTYREANRAGMLAQLVTDAAGNEMRLVDLLIERGKQVPDGLPRNKDRTVSRSKLTDEEKAAAGLMTGPELKAHNKLEKETIANPKKAERLDSSELFDPFATVPPTPNGGGA